MGRGKSDGRTPLDVHVSVPDLVMNDVRWRRHETLPAGIAEYLTPETGSDVQHLALSQTPAGVTVSTGEQQGTRRTCAVTLELVRAQRCCADRRACGHRAALDAELESAVEEVERCELQMNENEIVRIWEYGRNSVAEAFRSHTLSGAWFLYSRGTARISADGACLECGNAHCALGRMRSHTEGLTPWGTIALARIEELRGQLAMWDAGFGRYVAVSTFLPLARGQLRLNVQATWREGDAAQISVTPSVRGLGTSDVNLWPIDLRGGRCECFDSGHCHHPELVRALAPALFERDSESARRGMLGIARLIQ